VEVRDAAGNVVAGSRAPGTLDFQTTPRASTLHGSTTGHAVAGAATFSGISIQTPPGADSPQAKTPGLAPGGSSSFTIQPAASKALQFVASAAQDTAGQALPMEVHAVDRFGNLTPSAVGSVFLNFAVNPTGATLINSQFSATLTAGIAPLTIF